MGGIGDGSSTLVKSSERGSQKGDAGQGTERLLERVEDGCVGWKNIPR